MENVMRLIDANKIMNGIALYAAENAYLNDTALDVLKMVGDWLKCAPTVDAVEVVRCKDCKHRGDYPCPMYYDELVESNYDGYRECDWVEHDNTKDDGFCHIGERENGDGNVNL